MAQYAEVSLPQIGPIGADLTIEVRAEARRICTSLLPLDDFLGGFWSGQVTLIDSSDKLLFDLVHLLCIDQVRNGEREAVWVDGGNSVNPYALSCLCKRFRINTQDTLDSINISRAFTAYQFVTLIEDLMETEVERTGAGLLVISCFPDLFQDKDMWWSESLQLMKRCLASIEAITKKHDLVTVVTNFGLSKMLYKKSLRSMLYGSADRVLRIESARSALNFTLVNEGRSMLYHSVPYYQRTLDEFY